MIFFDQFTEYWLVDIT